MKFQVGDEVAIVDYIPFPEEKTSYKSYVGRRAKIVAVYPSDKAPYCLDLEEDGLGSVAWREEELEDPFVACCREALNDETTTV